MKQKMIIRLYFLLIALSMATSFAAISSTHTRSVIEPMQIEPITKKVPFKKRKLVESDDASQSKCARTKDLPLQEQQEYDTRLLKAAQDGDSEEIERLLQAGADKNTHSARYLTPFYHFTPESFLQILPQKKGQSTSLHRAAKRGHIKAVEVLLKADADKERVSQSGKTPLHVAAQEGHEAIVALLIKDGANLHAVDKYGDTPLHKAARQGHQAIVALLIARGAHLHALNAWKNGPLHLATEGGDKEVVRFLIEQGANVNAVNKHSWTALHYAAWKQSTFVPNGKDKTGYPIFKFNPRGSHTEVIEMLLTAGADKKPQDQDKLTPLHIATRQSRDEATITLLLEGDTYRDQEDRYGNTPLSYILDWTLHIAEHNTFPKVTYMFLLSGNEELIFAPRSQALLQEWGFNHNAFKRSLAMSKKILQEHCDGLRSLFIDKGMPTVLATLIIDYHKSLDLRMLLFNHIEVLNEGLLKAAQYGNRKETERFLNAGADLDAEANKYGKTALHFATQNGCKEIVTFLIERHANVNAVDKTGLTPLHLAAEMGDKEIGKLLIEQRAHINATDHYNWTPLHWASQNGHKEMVAFLIENKADIGAVTKNNYTALHLATDSGNTQAVGLLIKNRANINVVDTNSWTPLHWGANKNHKGMIDMLLSAGANKTARDKNGQTPLHITTQKVYHDEAIVILLLGEDAYSECEDTSGDTPLSYALRWALGLNELNLFPRITQMLLLAGGGNLTFAPQSQELLKKWGFKEESSKKTLEISKKLQKEHAQDLCVILLHQGIPVVLGMLINTYHQSFDTRWLLLHTAYNNSNNPIPRKAFQ